MLDKKGGRHGLVGDQIYGRFGNSYINPFKFLEKEKQTLKLMYTCHSFRILSELHLKSY